MSETYGAFGSWFDGKSDTDAIKGATIFPPQMVELQGPVVFLAGPIKGSARWQDEAIKHLEHNAPWLNIASPRKSLDRAADYTEGEYISQADWESHYLRVAAKEGVILIFFAKEETHYCDRPFARTTRIEFGEWMAHHELEGTRLVVGFEEGFDGDKYIRHRLQTLPGVPIGETLEEALQKVIVAAGCRASRWLDAIQKMGEVPPTCPDGQPHAWEKLYSTGKTIGAAVQYRCTRCQVTTMSLPSGSPPPT